MCYTHSFPFFVYLIFFQLLFRISFLLSSFFITLTLLSSSFKSEFLFINDFFLVFSNEIHIQQRRSCKKKEKLLLPLFSLIALHTDIQIHFYFIFYYSIYEFHLFYIHTNFHIHIHTCYFSPLLLLLLWMLRRKKHEKRKTTTFL